MEPKKIVLLAGALIIAVTAAFLARSMFASNGAPRAQAAAMPNPKDMPHVLVATKSLPVGTIVGTDAYRFQPWPKELVEDAYFIEGKVDLNKLVGSVVRNAIAAGQPVTQGSLINPGDRGFLAAALAPGMRAVTVPVSMQTSVAGFIFPGDHVDLMLTQSVAGGGDGPPLKVSETILRNLRVLATDQRTTAMGDDGKPEVRPYSNVTVEVTPKMAEKIAVAKTVGSLSLSLRSLADNNQGLEQALASGTIDPAQADAASADDKDDGEKTMLASLASRPTSRDATYSTGADVSRYQRRTVPTKPLPQSAQPETAGGDGKGPIVHISRGTQVTNVAVGSK